MLSSLAQCLRNRRSIKTARAFIPDGRPAALEVVAWFSFSAQFLRKRRLIKLERAVIPAD